MEEFYNELIETIRLKKNARAKSLINSIDFANRQLRSALGVSIAYNNVEIFNLLFTKRLNIPKVEMENMFISAASTGALSIVKTLLAEGVAPTCTSDLALKYSVFYGHFEITKVLLSQETSDQFDLSDVLKWVSYRGPLDGEYKNKKTIDYVKAIQTLTG